MTRRRLLLWLTGVVLCCALPGWTRARGDEPAVIEGYVTSAISASDFHVNGLRVTCSAQTTYGAQKGPSSEAARMGSAGSAQSNLRN